AGIRLVFGQRDGRGPDHRPPFLFPALPAGAGSYPATPCGSRTSFAPLESFLSDDRTHKQLSGDASGSYSVISIQAAVNALPPAHGRPAAGLSQQTSDASQTPGD